MYSMGNIVIIIYHYADTLKYNHNVYVFYNVVCMYVCVCVCMMYIERYQIIIIFIANSDEMIILTDNRQYGSNGRTDR